VKARSFAKLLEEAIKKYQNRAIETAQIIDELINLGRKIREESERGDKLNLTDDEVAFYDALADNKSARDVLGDEKLSIIARELVEMIRNNVTIDWTIRDNVQAKIRVMVKRILRQYGYPPDKTKMATELVLEQANVICCDWAG
ncbi:MAG: DEAD/DEAH box helicase, partial [Nitrospirae bacterium CG_4_8_14_3_um_filter_41_47]